LLVHRYANDLCFASLWQQGRIWLCDVHRGGSVKDTGRIGSTDGGGGGGGC